MKKGLINMTKYNIKQTPKISILVVSKYIYIYFDDTISSFSANWKWWNSIIEIYYNLVKSMLVLFFEATKMLIFGVCFILYFLNLSGKNAIFFTSKMLNEYTVKIVYFEHF